MGLEEGEKDITDQRNNGAKAWRLESTLLFPSEHGCIMFVGSQGYSTLG